MFADKEQTLGVMSIGFLLHSHTDAVVWRGPKKNGQCQQHVNPHDLFLVALLASV